VQYTVAVTIDISREEWIRAYGDSPTTEGVKEYLENAIFVGTAQQTVTVHHIVEHE